MELDYLRQTSETELKNSPVRTGLEGLASGLVLCNKMSSCFEICGSLTKGETRVKEHDAIHCAQMRRANSILSYKTLKRNYKNHSN